MGHADPKGYYRILNVAPFASATAVRKAYRRRSKELHPDTNQRLGAAEQFAALNEAYRVLSDPAARARYDTADLERDAPGATASDAPVPCARCRRVSAQPRYLIFHQVIGRLWRVDHDRIQGVYCPRCARDVGVGASLMTWALGWWGLPDGPWAALKAIWRNMRGGEAPPDANARLLAHQARAFMAQERPDLARALAARAAQLDPASPDAPALNALAAAGEGPPPQLRDPWTSVTRAAPVHLAPGLLIGVLVVMVQMVGGGNDNPRVRPPTGPPGWHVTEEGAAMRAGPGRRYAVVATLGRFEGVSLRPARTEEGWVPVWAGDLEGFLPSAAVGTGPGSAARAAWCREAAGERPATATVLRRGARGPHGLSVANRTARDAVLKLRDADGATVLAVYVRAGDRADVADLPNGALQPVYALGSAWSLPCGTFTDGMETFTRREPADFAAPPAGDPGPAGAVTLALEGVAGGDLPVDPAVFRAD